MRSPIIVASPVLLSEGVHQSGGLEHPARPYFLGNRTAENTNDFTYDEEGQLTGCDTGCGTIAYDDAGRTSRWNGWYLTYDGEGRLATACKVDGCATGDMVTMRSDAQGRRVELVTRTGATTTTTTFRYQGEAIAQELVGGSLSRTYVTDEAGAIVKFCDPDCSSGSNPQYLVTWNGHGDAMAAWKIDPGTGALTLANSYTYSAWGQPTTTTHNGNGDLKFRFLYVGRHGVAWDNDLGLGLHNMRARHYSPVLGRFLQPDPSALDDNLYAYTANSPVTHVDPSGWSLLLRDGAGGSLGWRRSADHVRNRIRGASATPDRHRRNRRDFGSSICHSTEPLARASSPARSCSTTAQSWLGCERGGILPRSGYGRSSPRCLCVLFVGAAGPTTETIA